PQGPDVRDSRGPAACAREYEGPEGKCAGEGAGREVCPGTERAGGQGSGSAAGNVRFAPEEGSRPENLGRHDRRYDLGGEALVLAEWSLDNADSSSDQVSLFNGSLRHGPSGLIPLWSRTGIAGRDCLVSSRLYE